MAKIYCYPVGTADSTLIDPTSRRLVLIDFANKPADAEASDKRIDLAAALDERLEEIGADAFAVVAFTHLDLDHIRGASAYFHFDHARSLQGNGRKKITTLWVPAAIITQALGASESEDHKVIQKEARHRLRQGQGIRVVSCPDDLKVWLRAEGLPVEGNSSIVHAGTIAPEFSIAQDGVEFFIHAPASDAEDISDNVQKNEESILLQARFVIGGTTTNVLLLSDAPHELLTDIVIRSERSTGNNRDRLNWDVVHTPHHCSYKSIGDTKAEPIVPVEAVKRLYDTYGAVSGRLIVSSDPIPTEETTLPPHREAYSYYRRVAGAKGGEVDVTMEWPNRNKPQPMVIEIDENGHSLRRIISVGAAGLGSVSAPRAG